MVISINHINGLSNLGGRKWKHIFDYQGWEHSKIAQIIMFLWTVSTRDWHTRYYQSLFNLYSFYLISHQLASKLGSLVCFLTCKLFLYPALVVKYVFPLLSPEVLALLTESIVVVHHTICRMCLNISLRIACWNWSQLYFILWGKSVFEINERVSVW